MNSTVAWEIVRGDSPIVAAAIHNGHAMCADVAAQHQLSEEMRLREEDPFTGEWTTIAETRIIGTHSRFQVDLNRPRDKSVYIAPSDCWGLSCWKQEPPEELVSMSQSLHDRFYGEVHGLLESLVRRYRHVVVYDLHSYNHRREGPDARAADPRANPEVNLGTGTMERSYWRPVVEALGESLRSFDYSGRSLDVRENIKFQGGYFSRWIHENFPRQACSVAIEFKKFFMDEWTGAPDRTQLQLIRDALAASLPAVHLALRGLG